MERAPLTERQMLIASALKNNPKIQVEELADMFNVSKSTIQRELKEIKKNQLLFLITRKHSFGQQGSKGTVKEMS